MSTKKRRITFYGPDQLYNWYQSLPAMKRGKLLVELLESVAGDHIAAAPKPTVAEIIRKQQAEKRKQAASETDSSVAGPVHRSLQFDSLAEWKTFVGARWDELDAELVDELAEFAWEQNGEFSDSDALATAFNESVE